VFVHYVVETVSHLLSEVFVLKTGDCVAVLCAQ
jgi:hypothetical protein